uniref:Uncharacterized protein n=1 Tax=Helianthus annuus TaxID=4232 RepID=A0A251SHN1_HELAN
MAVQQDQRIRMGSGKLSVDDGQENKSRAASDVAKLLDNNKLSTKEKPDSVSSESKIKDTHEIDNFSTEKKKKKRKRKRKQVDDLRFVAELGAVGPKRKERKKKLLEERKKKHKKAKQEDDFNFLGREEKGCSSSTKIGQCSQDMFACAFEQHREKGVATPLSVALAVYGGYDFTLRDVFFW